MFLNSLKAKSIVRKVEKLTRERSYKSSSKRPTTIAMLQERSSPFNSMLLKKLETSIGDKVVNIDVLSYAKALKKEDQESNSLFSDKEIGWKGVLKSKRLKEFSRKRYDILISYYKSEALSLQLITASSQAIFKVGVSTHVEEMNDLTISVKNGEEDVFIEELTKYLKVLKIID